MGTCTGCTERGGTNGQGFIYRITPAGTYTTLYTFAGQADGGRPQGALILGSNGDLYGSTTLGGTNGGGTFFRITLGGVLTTITNLSSDVEQPHTPEMSLLEIDNNLYGVTLYGGNANRGAAFKLSFDGSLTSLASFEGLAVGSIPTSLILSRESVAYGTTALGGNKNSGTIFKRVGSDVITLHSFSGGAEGAKPSALVQATDGNLYMVQPASATLVRRPERSLRSIPRAISRRSLPGLRTQVWAKHHPPWCRDRTATSMGQRVLAAPPERGRSSNIRAPAL